MGFIKIGSIVRIEKVGSTINDLQLGAEQLKRLGSRIATADFVNLNPGKFVYTRERAVSAFERYGLNGNADGFFDSELRQRYASFINSPRYIDHNNGDISQAIGIVLDAVYHPLSHPQGGWVETVSALDKEKMAQIVLHGFPNQPTMLNAVIAGDLTDVSMGCYVEESLCTVCGNKAATEHDYCDHVIAHRGKRIKAASTCPVPVDTEGFVVAGELNFGVTFFELSNITSLAQYGGGGADADAKILEKVACSGWECYIIDRFPRQLAERPTRANGSYCSCTGARTNIRPMNQEGNMGDLRKKGVEVAPVAPEDAQSVTDRITSATDPGDDDKALFNQSKGKSDGGNDAAVTDPDRISQEKKPPDYPLTARNKNAVGVEADPANKLGGEPEPVAQEKDKLREEKFKSVKPELGDRGPEVEQKMEKELDEEEPLSNALGALFTRRFPTVASSERFKEIQDELDSLELRRSSVLSALKRTRSEKRKVSLKTALKEINAGILKYFGQFAGNPQDMDETFKDGYDIGADKKLYNQGKPGSEKVKPQTVAVPDGITQEKDPADYPLKGAKKVIASTEADKAAKEMLDLVWHQGKSFEEAQQIIFDRYGSEVSTASRRRAECGDGKGYDSKAQQGFMHSKHPQIAQEMDKNTEDFKDLPEKSEKKESAKDGGEKPAESLDEMKEKAEKDKDKEARRRVNAEGENPVEVDEASGKSDIGQPMGDDKEEIDKGNTTTIVSPETKKVAPSSELIQARLSRPRAALYQQVLGVGSAETELKKGNEDTLASPDTKEKADAETKEQEKRTKNLSQGVNVPAEITGSLGLAMATLTQAQKEVIALRQQNVRLAKRLTAVKANWKWEEVKKVAFTMLKKGFFLEDPKTGSQRNWLQQKEAMINEAKNLLKKSDEEVMSVKNLVARAPMPGRPVKEWTKRIAMPREGTVKSAIAARSAANPDEVTMEHMFD